MSFVDDYYGLYSYVLLGLIFALIIGLALAGFRTNPGLAAISSFFSLGGFALIFLGYIGIFEIVDCGVRVFGGMCYQNGYYNFLATFVGVLVVVGGIAGAFYPAGKKKPRLFLLFTGLATVILFSVPSFLFNYLYNLVFYLVILGLVFFMWFNAFRIARFSKNTKTLPWVGFASFLVLFLIYAPFIPMTVPYASVDYPNCGPASTPCPSGGFSIDASVCFSLSGIGEVYVPVDQTDMSSGWYWSPYLQGSIG